ncbi:thiamine diphosphokinase [Palleronia caenipelagi]|uniref:Thiamine diphosphokinase n=1 Tax=Palleronia caenipelagi TaxID=2489174 RepID=A0A547Q7V8_9RHOB|nr:thiamine diphosphokinase [Palleronia caenipelagi]TRD22453.1 thiamine diphosphokinase [Palleronia caenipelagi]
MEITGNLPPTPAILSSRHPVTLVGDGPVRDEEIHWSLQNAPRVVAADGGAAKLIATGVQPQHVIGDMDSLPRDLTAQLDPARLHKVDEQDSTDFQKCLSRIEAPLVIGLGFLGGRLDHTLASLTTLIQSRTPCLLIGDGMLAFHVTQDIAMELPMGSLLSLYPLRRVTGRSEGLRWPIDGITLDPSGRVGTSNEVSGSVKLSFDNPGMIVILPDEVRDAALAALSSSGR